MSLERKLEIWVRNKILDEAAAKRIREFERRRSAHAQRTYLLFASFVMALASGLFGFWSLTTQSGSSWELAARFATYFAATGGGLLLVYWNFRAIPSVPAPSIAGILAATASLSFASVVTKSDSLALLLDLCVLTGLTALLSREKFGWMFGLSLGYLTGYLSLAAFEQQRAVITLLGAGPLLFRGFEAGTRWLAGTPMGEYLRKIAWPRIGRLHGSYVGWAGPLRGQALLTLAGASAVSALIESIPRLGPFVTRSLEPQRWIWIVALPVFLSLLPRERPGFSATLSVPAWGLLALRILRFDARGPMLQFAGTGFAPWKLVMGSALLLAVGAMAQNFIRGKKSVWLTLELGPIGFAGVALLLATL